jgi:hypothetical protein
MKNHILSALAITLITNYFAPTTCIAQAPQGIPYQAIARNASGVAISNSAVKVRFTIRDSIATGAIKYQETHNPTTSALGLFSVNVGMGTVVSGTFSGINWGKNAKFMQVELDPAGGTSYTDLGTTQMMSVPYALHAGSASSFMKSFSFDTLVVFETAGSYSWTAPMNVTKVMIECWGGGGGGSFTSSVQANGGGGGGYAKGIYKVVPNRSYQIIVGSEGIGQNSPYGNTNLAGDGGTSSFGAFISADGGFSGTSSNQGLGGDGHGQFNIKGGDGFNLKNGVADPFGASSGVQTRVGVSPNGGSSGRFGGIAPGGGGASTCCGAGEGFRGAPVRVVIWY